MAIASVAKLSYADRGNMRQNCHMPRFEHFSAAFVPLRESKGLSNNRVAIEAGIDQGTMNKVENGHRKITANDLKKLETVFSPEEMQSLRKAAALDALAAKGLLDTEATPPVAESEAVQVKFDPLTPIEQMGLRRLPRFESVACGWGALADEQPVDWDMWPAAIANGADHTVVARGDSMKDAGISSGDLVFVQKTSLAPKRIPSGTTVIAYQGDGEYLCKRLVHGRHSVSWLQGMADGHMEPIYLHEHPEIRIVGIVTGVFKVMG